MEVSPLDKHQTAPPSKAKTTTNNVAIVGGGLVGSLAAVYMARRGYKVDLFEARSDIRKEQVYSGRSINLALSARGISALTRVGAQEEIVKNGIPMFGRMLHSHDGKLTSQSYGLNGEYIMSIDRRKLNERLLSIAEEYSNVHLHFEHKLRKLNLDSSESSFLRPDGSTIDFKASFVLGADGAYSTVRQEIMRKTRMNYTQNYIEHGYKELSIPPTASGEYAMNSSFLHIWPRHSFMMIALPNLDKTFTCTLFMPFEKFDAIQDENSLLEFFQAEFPDAIEIMGGREKLAKEYFANPVGSLMTVKCKPYHFKDRALIVGDAAHAMVPFYGQGMNTGFEDIEWLDDIFDFYGDDLTKSLAAFSERRHESAVAICDLALNNYIEMRSSVVSVPYQIERACTNFISKLLPGHIIPLYTMVAFTKIPFATVVERNRLQRIAINSAAVVGSFVGLISGWWFVSFLGRQLFRGWGGSSRSNSSTDHHVSSSSASASGGKSAEFKQLPSSSLEAANMATDAIKSISSTVGSVWTEAKPTVDVAMSQLYKYSQGALETATTAAKTWTSGSGNNNGTGK